MAKIGSYEYPETQLGTLLKAVEFLVKKFNGQAKDEKTFAEAIGHKTNKSGTFIQKLSDLRKYNFLEKRGLTATQRARNIVNPLNKEEKEDEINNAIMDIKLWHDLYERLKNTSPSLEDFKIHLIELTGDRNKAIAEGENIRNLYIDALSNYSGNIVNKVIKNRFNEGLDSKNKLNEDKVPEELLVLKSGEINISLPKSETNIGVLISVLTELKNEIKKPKVK